MIWLGGRGDVRVDVFGCCMDNHVKASFEANSELAVGEEAGGRRAFASAGT